jgi:type II secretory pathway pseudopilin PulG
MLSLNDRFIANFGGTMIRNKGSIENNSGFSLIGLIVVIAVMAVLIGIIAPKFLSYVEKTKIAKNEM